MPGIISISVYRNRNFDLRISGHPKKVKLPPDLWRNDRLFMQDSVFHISFFRACKDNRHLESICANNAFLLLAVNGQLQFTSVFVTPAKLLPLPSPTIWA